MTRRALTCLAIGAAGLLAAGCGAAAPAGPAARPAPPGHRRSAPLPAGALGQPGTIRFCSDISSPPLEFYANGQQPTGSDIDLGNAIAAKLGVKAQWVNTAFAGIIPALQAGHCDAILSQLFDKPARRAIVNFVDYMNSSEAIMVRKGNPEHVTGLRGLCGLNVAAETGTTVADFLARRARPAGSGKQPIAVQTFLRDSDALSQLGSATWPPTAPRSSPAATTCPRTAGCSSSPARRSGRSRPGSPPPRRTPRCTGDRRRVRRPAAERHLHRDLDQVGPRPDELKQGAR